ncbi:hypothetical protein bcere0022_21120 [Bacillus cereus Rock3-44]|nr:hypothetical protein bcere0022_21120 [Bacillus cereus Rock3-44]
MNIPPFSLQIYVKRMENTNLKFLQSRQFHLPYWKEKTHEINHSKKFTHNHLEFN